MIAWANVFGLWYEVAFEEMHRALSRCPENLWEASIWDVTMDPARPPLPVDPDGREHPLGLPALSAFWKVSFHALAANEWNLAGRPSSFQLAAPFSEIRAPFSGIGPDGTAREMLPARPPSKDDLLAYLGHNRQLVKSRLSAARDLGDGQAALGSWRGTTSMLLTLFHSNACHLVSHETELGMFINQNRA